MINLNSQAFKSLSKSIDKYFPESDISAWKSDLKSSTLNDGFLAFISHSKSDEIIYAQGYKSFNEWLMNVEEWSNKLLDPRNSYGAGAMLLYELWDNFKITITEALRGARLNSDIPTKGGMLVYVAGLSKCIVIEYYITWEYPRFSIVDIIDNPQSAFDFWGAISGAKMSEKNVLKEIISSGHKLIFHRGIIIHVDRRKDIQVFGPSIDTLLIAEIQAQLFYENNYKFTNALEIGCGNGLLSVSVAKYCQTIIELCSIDINFHSVYCLNNNLGANIIPHKLKRLKIYLTCGEFTETHYQRKFDLIICNPPYIPDEPLGSKITDKKADYLQAVGGTELIDAILNNLNSLLTRTGQLLLLVSNLSLKHTLDFIPKNFTYELVLKEGHKVLFDVEAVLKKQSWLSYLQESCGLIKEGEVYYHWIYPILIKRK